LCGREDEGLRAKKRFSLATAREAKLHVLTLFFLTRVKKGDFGEGKVADSKETKRCTELVSADGSPSDGPEEYAAKMLICIL
jgi:hypothetical protein